MSVHGLPSSTEIKKLVHKKLLYAKFPKELCGERRKQFDDDIGRIVVTNEISPVSVNIKEGEQVKSIFVLQVELKTKAYNERNIVLISKLFGQHLLIVLKYVDEVQLATYQTRLLHSEWMAVDDASVKLSGLDLEAVWESLVTQVSGIVVSAENSLDEQIVIEQEKAKLLQQIEGIEKKARKETQAKKYHAWRWSRQKIVNESYNLIVLPNSSGGYEVYTRIRDFNTTLLKDLITNVSNGDTEVQKLFGGKKYFDYPKSVDLLKILIGAVKDKDALILDFFSGSATTAHATMQLNREDGGNRQYIMVQIPDGIDEKSEAYKDGYHNLCEIGKERIRLAGAEIKEADIGFRVLKLDSSNMKDIYYNPAQIQQQSLFDSTDNIKEDRTPEDLLFQVMLDLGILLSSKIEEKTIAGKKVFNVADGFLIACFDNDVTEKTVKAVAQEKPYYAVFRDSSMANDSVATNFEQIFATYSPETVRKVL